MKLLTNIGAMVLNTPLMCTTQYAETVCAVLGDRIGINADQLAIGFGRKRDDSAPLAGKSGNVAVIPIIGGTTHRDTGIDAMSGMASYAALQSQIEAAMRDDDVDSIMLDIDSPGGSVAGLFDFADYLMAQRGRKPIVAFARETMASAAYMIGSSVDKIYVSRTSQVGSIGVVMMHTDQSAKLEAEGVKPTYIFAGDKKVMGNPTEALGDSARAELQAAVDTTYGFFVDGVAARRPMTREAIIGTQAGIFSGQAAIDIGLADEMATFEQAISDLSTGVSTSRMNSSTTNSHEDDMNKEELLRQGATEERTRIGAILGSDEAKGRETLANHFAFSTDMKFEDALAALAAGPVESGCDVDDSAALIAANEEIAKLKAASASDQRKAIAALAADAPAIPGDAVTDVAVLSEQDARAEEAATNARAALGPRARNLKS